MSKPKPKIVIVGAGAMGVLVGYHLALAGAETVFLVRPARAAKMPTSYRLYSYDDARTHDFGGFEVIQDAADIAVHRPEFVLVTLDGGSLASDEGKTLLAGIGDAIRDSDATLIIGSVGIGLRELALAASGLADARVVGGMIALVGHKTDGVTLPLHAPTDADQLAGADFAFRHLNEGGFLLDGRNASAAARFAEIFDACGIAKCFVVPPEDFGVQSRGIMPVFVTAEILGWPKAEVMFNDALWPVTVEAVRSIQSLGEHGEAGAAAAANQTAESLAGLWTYLESAALPLDWQGFNAYQHGEKVRNADALLLESCIARGESEGRDMSALVQLLHRLNDHLENRNV